MTNPSPAATKFINYIEAMSQWPPTTIVGSCGGNELTLKQARILVDELQSSANSTPTPATSPAHTATKPEMDPKSEEL